MGKENTKTLVFTATYNEEGNVRPFCEHVFGLSGKYDLLIVDDNSPDQTGFILDQIAAKEPRLTVVHRPGKLGLGSAHKLAIAYALRNNYDVLVTMDADFSHNPDDIPRLIATLGEDHDFVIGSRYMPGGKSDYVGYRRFVSVCANLAARTLLGVPLREYTTSFRAFRVSTLRKLNISQLRAQGYSFFLESTFRIHQCGFRCAEIPIHFQDRLRGESKIPQYEVFRGIRKLLQLFWSRITSRFAPVSDGGLVVGNCYNCNSGYLIELYPQSGNVINEDVSAYQCTSMTHKSKPQVVQCLECGLSFALNNGIVDKLNELYAGVVDEEYVANREARRRTFEGTYKKIESYLPPRDPTKKGNGNNTMLEVGAYCGYFLNVAKQKGWDVQGVEPSAWASSYAREKLKLPVITGSLDTCFNELPKNYPVVVMWDVLEHLKDPKSELQRCHQLLDKDGLFCFSTLSMDTWFPKVMGKRWPWLMDMHLFYFTQPVLKRMLEETGYELIAVTNYTHIISFPYFADKVASLLPKPLGRLVLLMKPILPHRIFIPFSFGDIKLFICRKTAFEQKKVTSTAGVSQNPVTC